jgi:hypothetical protein
MPRGVAHQRLGRAVLDQVGQVQVLLERARRHQVERVLHAAAQVEGLLLDLELADVGLRVVEDVVDDLQQRLAAGADGAREVALVLDIGVSSSSVVMPITALSGVRISWLMLARNRLLARAAVSASDLARSSASAWWWLSVTSVTVPM